MEGYELNFHAYKMLYKYIFDQLTEMSIGTHTKLAHVSCLNKSFNKYSIHLLIIIVYCFVFAEKECFDHDKGRTNCLPPCLRDAL